MTGRGQWLGFRLWLGLWAVTGVPGQWLAPRAVAGRKRPASPPCPRCHRQDPEGAAQALRLLQCQGAVFRAQPFRGPRAPGTQGRLPAQVGASPGQGLGRTLLQGPRPLGTGLGGHVGVSLALPLQVLELGSWVGLEEGATAHGTSKQLGAGSGAGHGAGDAGVLASLGGTWVLPRTSIGGGWGSRAGHGERRWVAWTRGEMGAAVAR